MTTERWSDTWWDKSRTKPVWGLRRRAVRSPLQVNHPDTIMVMKILVFPRTPSGDQGPGQLLLHPERKTKVQCCSVCRATRYAEGTYGVLQTVLHAACAGSYVQLLPASRSESVLGGGQRRAATRDDAHVRGDAHTDEGRQGQIHHSTQEECSELLQTRIWRKPVFWIDLLDSNCPHFIRSALSAMTMVFHMTVPPSCTMGQRHSPLGSGLWSLSQRWVVLLVIVLYNYSTCFQSCDLRCVGSAFDGRGATKNDWLLLNRISSQLCSSKKRPRKLRNGKAIKFDTKDRFNIIIN